MLIGCGPSVCSNTATRFSRSGPARWTKTVDFVWRCAEPPGMRLSASHTLAGSATSDWRVGNNPEVTVEIGSYLGSGTTQTAEECLPHFRYPWIKAWLIEVAEWLARPRVLPGSPGSGGILPDTCPDSCSLPVPCCARCRSRYRSRTPSRLRLSAKPRALPSCSTGNADKGVDQSLSSSKHSFLQLLG